MKATKRAVKLEYHLVLDNDELSKFLRALDAVKDSNLFEQERTICKYVRDVLLEADQSVAIPMNKKEVD